jgi:hypothetical protein
MFKLARDFNAPGVYSKTGSAFTETLLHEVGESVWKQLPASKRAEWRKLATAHDDFLSELNGSVSEKFAVSFSFKWLNDPQLPNDMRNWVKGLE